MFIPQIYLSVRMTAWLPTAEEIGLFVWNKFCHYHPHVTVLWLEVNPLSKSSQFSRRSQKLSSLLKQWYFLFTLHLFFFHLPLGISVEKPLWSIFNLLLDPSQFSSLFVHLHFSRLLSCIPCCWILSLSYPFLVN